MQQQEAAPASFIPPATTSPIMTAKITFFMCIVSFWILDVLFFMIRIRKDVEEIRMIL
jgi:hypothetical protein